MKKLINEPTKIVLSLFVILFISSASNCRRIPIDKTPQPKPVDSAGIVNKFISKELKSGSFAPSVPDADIAEYSLDQSFINKAPFLLGQLYAIDTVNNRIHFTSIGDESFLKSTATVTNKLLSTDPLFDTYVTNSVSTNLSVMKEISASLADSQCMHVNYQSIFTAEASTNNGSPFDLARAGKFIDSLNLTATYKHLFIIDYVVVDEFTYTVYDKMSIGGGGTVAGVISVNGKLFSQNGTAIHKFGLYVSTSEIPLKVVSIAALPRFPAVKKTKTVIDTTKMMLIKNIFKTAIKVDKVDVLKNFK